MSITSVNEKSAKTCLNTAISDENKSFILEKESSSKKFIKTSYTENRKNGHKSFNTDNSIAY